jgi:hypothetical protein
MSHKITLNFGNLGKSTVFGNQMFQLMPKGLYEVPTLTRINDATAEVSIFTAYICDSTNDLGCRIENDAAENVSVDPTTPYVIIRLSWVNAITNDYILLSSNLGGIGTDDIVLGKCNYTGSVLIDFDYTVQTLSPLRNNGTTLANSLNNIFFPSVYVATDYTTTSDQKNITLFVNTTITNRNITFATADINSVGNYLGIYNIAGANNVVANSIYTILPGRAMYFRCTQTGTSTYAWARVFSDEYQSGAVYPVVTPSKIGQQYIDTTNFRTFTAKGVASAADWVETTNNVTNIVTTAVDYTITDTLRNNTIIIANPNTASQYGILTITLPTVADTIGKEFTVRFGSQGGAAGGLIKVDGEGAETLSYSGTAIPYMCLFQAGGEITLYNSGINWKIRHCHVTFSSGWINHGDFSNHHLGFAVIPYDTKNAATDYVGLTGIEQTSNNTFVVLYDSGGAGNSGNLFCYNVTGTGIFTNNKSLTMSNGGTALVNTGTTTLDIESDIFHGLGIPRTSLPHIKTFINTTATLDGSFELFSMSDNNSSAGTAQNNLDINNLRIQTAATATAYIGENGVPVINSGTNAYMFISQDFTI